MARLSKTKKVDGAAIYEPLSDMPVDLGAIADPNTGLTDDGIMQVEFIRRNRRKFNLTYGNMTAAEIRYMVNLIGGKKYDYEYMEFGRLVKIKAYTSDVKYSVVDEAQGIYKGLSFSIIER